MKKWLAIHLPVFAAGAAVVIIVASLWSRSDREYASKEKELKRISDTAVFRERRVKDELRASEVMSSVRARELGVANSKLDTALKLVTYYRGLSSQGQATPDNPLPLNAPYAKFAYDDKLYYGWWEYPSGCYEINQHPIPFTVAAVRDNKGKWTASINTDELATYLGISKSDAEKMFYIQDFQPMETVRAEKWYDKIRVDGSLGYDRAPAAEIGLGYDMVRIAGKVNTNGEKGVFAGASWAPFKALP